MRLHLYGYGGKCGCSTGGRRRRRTNGCNGTRGNDLPGSGRRRWRHHQPSLQMLYRTYDVLTLDNEGQEGQLHHDVQ